MSTKGTYQLVSVIGLLLSLGTGCETTNTPATNSSASGGQSLEARVAAEAAAAKTPALTIYLANLTAQRDEASFYVRKIREKLPPASNEAFQGELLYEQARGSVNASMTHLQLALQAGQDPTADPSYGDRCEDSRQKIVAFREHAHRYTSPQERTQEKFIGTIGAEFIVGLGKSIWGEVSAGRKANAELRAKRAKELADKIETVKWTASFKEVK